MISKTLAMAVRLGATTLSLDSAGQLRLALLRFSVVLEVVLWTVAIATRRIPANTTAWETTLATLTTHPLPSLALMAPQTFVTSSQLA